MKQLHTIFLYILAPYSWIESGASNARDTITSGNVFSKSNGIQQTSSNSDRNIHFNGPGVSNWRNYTIKGKMKFDSANADFGVNFYSQWPDTARKYTLRRGSDGFARLYYSKNSTSDSLLAIIDTSQSDLMRSTNTWYGYKIYVSSGTSSTLIRAWIWNNNIPPSDTAGIDVSHSTTRLTQGIVGFATHSGAGNKYFSAVTIVTNDPVSGAYMAYEDFKADTLVDIKPYTPTSWTADYGKYIVDVGKDTTGFVLDTSGSGERLIYKHKAGAQYPVTCQIVPYTNLAWRDYEFSGKITKPTGAVYDSIWVGVDVYSGNGKQYRFMFRNDTMQVSGGGISEPPIKLNLGHDFDHGDSLFFKITAVTSDLTISDSTYKDSTISIIADVGINTSSLTTKFDNTVDDGDKSSLRIKTGFPAVFIDLNGKEDHATSAIKIEDIRVQKYVE